MKKKLVLLKAFYKKILIPSIFLLVITLIAELLFVYLLGTYRYFTLTDKSFLNLVEDRNSLYVMWFTLNGPGEQTLSELETMPAVRDIYTYRSPFVTKASYGDTDIRIIFTNTELFRDYMLLNAKSYFSETGMEGGVPQGIAVGDFINTNGRARDIELSFGGETMKVRVLGNIGRPYYIPSFTKAGTKMTSYEIMLPSPDTMILQDSPEMRAFLEEKGVKLSSFRNCFILTFQESTAEEKQAVYDFLEEHDLSYADAGTILDHSKEFTAERIRIMLPLPIYLTILATVLTLCFSVLFLHKKMELILTFYLCGCSKKRGYTIMTLSLGMIGALATLLNAVVLFFYQQGTQTGRIPIDDFILDRSVFAFLAGYWLLLLFLSVFASFLIYRRKSVATIRRKVDL